MLSFFAPVTCGRGGPLSFFFFSMAHLYPACPATRRKGCVCVMRYILPTKSNRFQPTDEVDRSLKVETSMCDVTKRDARQRHGNDQEEMEGNAVQGSKAAVAGACSTILDHDLVTTCLSSKVRFMVCELGFERKANYAVHTFVTGNAQIYWKTIVEHVHYSETDHSVDYVKSVRSLGPLCESVHLHLQTLTMEQFEEQFVMWFQWTRSSEIFLEMFGILKCPHSTAIELSLMKLTSCLERALGDVFLLIGKDCPFLLRDLLASWELSTIFGQSVMDVLRVFIGSPDGLNLRNILWHGFASPQEIPVKYSSMLLLLTVGLGQLLKNYLLQTQSDLIHRPYVSLTNLKEMHVFPDLSHELLSLAEELVVKSSIVLKTMRPFWITVLTLFRQHRYVDCVMLLLSQLESGLRLLFTTVNNCPSRLITAETSFLYTTFDEMLAKQLSNEEINKLPLVLGESAMEFLWDFLNHQEGPRIRDHLSHGEISLNNFPKEIANSLLAFSVTLLSRYSKDEIAAVKEHAFLRPLVSCANNYCSQCHPIALLKKQILQCVKSINLWSELPVVPNEQEMTGLMVELCRKPVRMLFCPRSVLEVTVVLRQISVQCHQVSCQVISSCETRYNQWVNKSLRSRQRHNYLRLRRSIKCVSRVFKLILMLITLELISIHAVCDKNPTEYQQYLKSLKLILQYMENLVTYTSPEKNKWDETLDLTYKALIKIRTFLEKHQMLMQLAR
ncbi:endoplasmic reticulum membrane-associated RNA degradation protein isoform X2 [Sphaerodactylus townsendi]|uniref:endoplasmic reticulum membrane-associated RNA degradation protein isoform X2 n=1 Tax=Sphaerodactylus townsendi TaxID=933632 RepID=UPI002026E0DF|nr:endoplasmic reticulum membrane-associated RNA degradation protein isoform X2 [Sphaerodactylus townsendi]